MKSILMSIKPQYVTDILNGKKTIEIRKKFPKDYVGWVYIYCTKGNKHECLEYADNPNPNKKGKWCITSGYPYANGKVVARFWCDKVECAYNFLVEELCQLACITEEELYKYAGGWYKTDDLLAIHITKLEIFDKPKELSEFGKNYLSEISFAPWAKVGLKPLTRAPQSWCYVEV